MELGIEGEVNEDQIEGLTYLLEELRERDRNILLLRYMDQLTYQSIGSAFNITGERAKQVIGKLIRKLKKPERAVYYQEGYVETLSRVQEEKEAYKRSIMEKICEASQGTDKTGFSEVSISDLDLSSRAANCLTRANIDTLEDLLVLMADSPLNLARIRNLGRASYEEIIGKLEEYGIDVGKLVATGR